LERWYRADTGLLCFALEKEGTRIARMNTGILQTVSTKVEAVFCFWAFGYECGGFGDGCSLFGKLGTCVGDEWEGFGSARTKVPVFG